MITRSTIPGPEVFAALNNLDEHEFAGQLHFVEGTWLVYAHWPLDPAVREVPPQPAASSLEEAIFQNLLLERRVRLAERVHGLPEMPLVVFFRKHRKPTWPDEVEWRGWEDRYRVSRDTLRLVEADIVVVYLPNVQRAGSGPVRLNGKWFRQGFMGTMGELLCAIEEGRAPANSAESAMDGLALCFAAIDSAATGQPRVPGKVRRAPDGCMSS